MRAAPSSAEHSAVLVADCQARIAAIFSGSSDPFGRAWDHEMGVSERHFWLRAAGLGGYAWGYRDRKWQDMSGETRATIKRAVRQAADRAKLLLGD